jgi:hypothetical protein|tara:strand:+ start:404 stop:862 length:459 start_codon:yes stop_codon:yes gene_type:complete
MQYDEIIECPKSGGDLCYKIEVSADITQYMSLSCGFWSNTLLKVDSDFYNEQMELLPELYKALAWLDTKTDLIWLPTNVNVPELGMIYASGKNPEEWEWVAVKAVKLDEPIEDKMGNKLDYKPDMKSAKSFKERDFIEALDYIGALPQNPEA